MTVALAPVWLDIVDRIGGRTARKRLVAERVVAALAGADVRLAAGEPGGVLDEAHRKRILTAALRGVDPADEKLVRNLLALAAEIAAMKLGWRIPAFGLMTIQPRSRPVVGPDAPHLAQQTAHLRERLLASIGEDKREEASDWVIGRTLLTAVLCGGLLCRRWWRAWATAIAENGVRVDGCVWVEMVRTSRESWARPIYRRWFADPVSAALILRDREQFATAWRKLPDINLDAQVMLAVRQLTRNDTSLFATVSNVLDQAAALWAECLPPVLVHYARSDLVAVSLPPATWGRMVRGRPIEPPVEKAGARVSTTSATISPPRGGMSLPEREAALRTFRQKVLPAREDDGQGTRPASARKLRDVVKANPDWPPVLRTLGLWAAELRGPRGSAAILRQAEALEPSSVDRYLSSIGPPLMALSGDNDVRAMDAEDALDLYQGVIDWHAGSAEAAYSAGRLYQFHSFLQVTGAAPGVDFSELEGAAAAGLPGVSANIITEREFRTALALLDQADDLAPRIRAIGRLMLILGYYLGLRRGEARHLMLRDIHQGLGELQVLVHPSRFGKLKTAGSKRSLPAHVLMPRWAREELVAWVKRRAGETGDPHADTPLFTVRPTDDVPIAAVPLMTFLIDVLQMATGDAVVYHHLRHSFVSRLALCLLVDDNVGATILPSNEAPERRSDDDRLLACLAAPDEEPAAMVRRIRRGLMPGATIGRGDVYILSALAGHSAPDITLLSYMHVLDWLLGRGVCRHVPAVDLATAQTLTGVSRATAYREAARQDRGDMRLDLNPLLLPVFRRNSGNPDIALPPALAYQAQPPTVPAELCWDHRPSVVTMAEALQRRNEHPENNDTQDLGTDFALSTDHRTRLRDLTMLRTRKGRIRHDIITPHGGLRQLKALPDRELFDALIRASRNDDCEGRIANLALLIVHRSGGARHEIRLRTPMEVIDALLGLDALAISRAQIAILGPHINFTAVASNEHDRLRRWQTRWVLRDANGWLIRVAAKVSGNPSGIRASAGFRFAMLAIAVIRGVSKPGA